MKKLQEPTLEEKQLAEELQKLETEWRKTESERRRILKEYREYLEVKPPLEKPTLEKKRREIEWQMWQIKERKKKKKRDKIVDILTTIGFLLICLVAWVFAGEHLVGETGSVIAFGFVLLVAIGVFRWWSKLQDFRDMSDAEVEDEMTKRILKEYREYLEMRSRTS